MPYLGLPPGIRLTSMSRLSTVAAALVHISFLSSSVSIWHIPKVSTWRIASLARPTRAVIQYFTPIPLAVLYAQHPECQVVVSFSRPYTHCLFAISSSCVPYNVEPRMSPLSNSIGIALSLNSLLTVLLRLAPPLYFDKVEL